MSELARATGGRRPAGLLLRFDGGSRGNPGPSGSGWALWEVTRADVVEGAESTALRSETTLACGWRYCGRTTNNVAEYDGLIQGLRAAAVLRPRTLRVEGDSRLVIEQAMRRFAVRAAHLKPLLATVHKLLKALELEELVLDHIPRVSNAVADSNCNAAMSRRCSRLFCTPRAAAAAAANNTC